MSPPGPPPDPPEYGPSKPQRGREDTGVGRAAPTTELIVEKLNELNKLLRNRDEQSDIRNGDTDALRLRVAALLEEDAKRRKDDDERRARQARNRRLFWSVGTAAGLIVAAAVTAYQQSRPEPPSIENVQQAVEERTTELERTSQKTTQRVDVVDRKVERLVDLLAQIAEAIESLRRGLHELVDAIQPRAKKGQPDKSRRERDLRQLFEASVEDSAPP